MDNTTVIVGVFNTSRSVMDRKIRQNTKTAAGCLNNTISKLDPTDVWRTPPSPPPSQQWWHMRSSLLHVEHFPGLNICHFMRQVSVCCKGLKSYQIHSLTAVKWREISNRKKFEGTMNMCKLKNMPPNN